MRLFNITISSLKNVLKNAYFFCLNFLRKLGAVGTPRSLRLHLHLPQRSSHRQIQMESGSYDRQRGALIVLEGLDRCGKTSQSSRLVSHSREKRIFCRIMEVSGQNRQCWGDDICSSFQQITAGRSNNSIAFQCQSLGEEIADGI